MKLVSFLKGIFPCGFGWFIAQSVVSYLLDKPVPLTMIIGGIVLVFIAGLLTIIADK